MGRRSPVAPDFRGRPRHLPEAQVYLGNLTLLSKLSSPLGGVTEMSIHCKTPFIGRFI